MVFAGTVLAGHLPPLTVKDVALMLRTGYSAEAVQRELASRHLIGSVGADEELALTRANAAASLIAEMKSGAFAVPAEEVAAAQSQLAAGAAHRAAEAERSRAMDTLYQEQLMKRRAAAPALPGAKHAVGATLENSLLTMKDGKAVPVDGEAAASKKLIGLYYSARWCGPCRKFTPKLVEFYNRVAPQHPEFEIVFVSNDHSRAEMESYMREEKMPWPALDYDKVKGRVDLQKFAGDGIPCLVIVDANGHVVSDSYAGKEYRGPQSVLDDLDQRFANAAAPQVAQSR
jgi:nucleoredoxin